MTFLRKVTEYYVEIEVTKVNINREFPLGSYYDSGSRNWTNDIAGKRIVIGRIALEDLIHFQKVEFELIRGYYFNEGHNKNINGLITHLYDERFKMKREGNPAQQAVKLLMNSIYGKLLQKPVTTDTVIKDSLKDFNKFLELNYNFIESAVEIKIGRKSMLYIQRIKPIINQHNYIHCAVNILDMSKRIMNRVMCLAEDKGIKIYYQDTDSMHLPLDDVPKLAAHYKARYKKTLIGKGMGQFETDFSMGLVDANDEDSLNNWDKKADVYAVESFFLGKKVYLDVLESKNKMGETIRDYHIRAKGIPNDAMYHYVAAQRKMSTMDKQRRLQETHPINTVKDAYQSLYDGDQLKFDLTCGGNNCGFVYSQNPHEVTNYKYGKKDGQFTRRVSFIGERITEELCKVIK